MSEDKKYIEEENPLIEEISVKDEETEEPNFILGDRRKEIAIHELILAVRAVKKMMAEKRIEIQINVK